MTYRTLFVIAIALALAFCASGQTTTATTDPALTSLQAVKLPAFIFGGVSYNGAFNGVVSGLDPITSNANCASCKIYASLTADVSPAKLVDPATNTTNYYLVPSFRAGFHKVVWDDGTTTTPAKNMFLFGLDAGAAFSSTPAIPASTSSAAVPAGTAVNFTGAGTITYVRVLGKHIAVALPTRWVWVPNAVAGKGAFKLAAEIGVVLIP